MEKVKEAPPQKREVSHRQCCIEDCQTQAIWRVFNRRGYYSNFCNLHKNQIMERQIIENRPLFSAERIIEVLVG